MKINNRNIRVIAENNGNAHGFNIFLVFSGRREFLMNHRHNGMLFEMLKDGVAVDDLRRWNLAKMCKNARCDVRMQKAAKLHSMVNHLLRVIDTYILEQEYV